MVITSLGTTVTAQTTQTNSGGNVTTTEPSDKYGPGGTHSTTSGSEKQSLYAFLERGGNSLQMRERFASEMQ
jgi:hypothetical protein